MVQYQFWGPLLFGINGHKCNQTSFLPIFFLLLKLVNIKSNPLVDFFLALLDVMFDGLCGADVFRMEFHMLLCSFEIKRDLV